jgi:hypothetical protein
MALLNICVGVDEMHGIAGAREANITLELGMQVGLRLFNCQNRARNLPRLLPPLQVLQQERQKQDVGRTEARIAKWSSSPLIDIESD